METSFSRAQVRRVFPLHGWIGLALVLAFWAVNWLLDGLRTFWAFFPLWLGYSLIMDALAYQSNGTSLLMRDWKRYFALFAVSIPGWWLFEAINERVQNWQYLGVDALTPLEYFLISSINFSVVMPAVFSAAEWISGAGWVQRMKPWLVVRPDRRTTLGFFIAGWVMLALLLVFPQYCFPFVWISVYCILEPINIWLGNRSLADYTRNGNWKPVVSLFVGVLITGFFWELWNFHSMPKWIYTVPFVGNPKLFEMPVLGYGGYLPFALELFAMYHLVTGFFKGKKEKYILSELSEA